MERDRISRQPAGEGSGPTPEHEPAPYYRAARFPSERPAGHAYQQAQELVYQADLELSCFRFLIQRAWHVTVLGDPPPDDIDHQIEQILMPGEAVTLSEEVLGFLSERRQAATQLGQWVEGHYREGGDT
jgi:hypothetical protein